MSSSVLQPQITLLEETYDLDQRQGKPKLLSNINVCMALADVVRDILGPRGDVMGKFIKNRGCGFTTISNDGAIINIFHAAANFLVYMGQHAVDVVGGDAATTFVLLVAEFLKEAKPFVENDVDHDLIRRVYREASSLAIQRIKELAVSIEEGRSLEEKKILLAKFASATLSSKLIGAEKEFLASMVVDVVLADGNEDLLNMIGVKKVSGGMIRDSFVINGVAFKTTFSYAGIEHQPKKLLHPKILLLLNIELEIKSAKENEEISLSDPLLYQSVLDAEWNNIFDKLDKCVKSGANIVLSRLPIDYLGARYFADHDIFCAGGVAEEDLCRVAAVTGATIQTTMKNITDKVLGSCDVFEEQQVENEQFNVFSGCSSGQTATIVLRGGADEFSEEAERSLHDTIMAVSRVVKSSSVVDGGGAIDMEISRYLMQHAHTVAGESQDALLLINSYAKALEVIPRQLCDNAGFDAADVLNKLTQKHALPSGEGASYGVDVNTGELADSFANFVWEPADVKMNLIKFATENACMLSEAGENDKTPESKIVHSEGYKVVYLGRRVRDTAGFTRRQLRKIKLWGVCLCLESIFVTVLLLGKFPFVSGLMCLVFAGFWGMLVKMTITKGAKSVYKYSNVKYAINTKTKSASGDAADMGVLGGGRHRGQGMKR